MYTKSNIYEARVIKLMVNKLLNAERVGLLNLDSQLDYVHSNSTLFKAFKGELGTNNPTKEIAIELLSEVLAEQVK